LVVGATYPNELARVRELAPALPLLVPGVGAQGGDAQAVVAAAHRSGAPVVVNSSRAILYAEGSAAFAAAAQNAARSTRDALNAAAAAIR
jgi:orotidine-5'-phosphate decarboxylase